MNSPQPWLLVSRRGCPLGSETNKYDKLIADGLCVQPRWGVPEDIGKAVAALARGDFPFSTGQVVMVDGGLTIPRL
ncbi:MAG TPA: SDR family oxidoreductase [Opitutaceae bacterium]